MPVSSFVSNLMDPLGLKKPQMSVAPKAPVSPLQPLAIPTVQKTQAPTVPNVANYSNPNYTPANYSPNRSMTTGTPSPTPTPTTSTGKNINPATGGISDTPVLPPAPVVPPTPVAPPTYTPQKPVESPYQAPTVPQSMYDTQGEAMKAYLASLNPTDEEEANNLTLENLKNSETLGLNKIKDQPIPMDFITGQSASVQRQALALQEPLAQKAARLQAKRLAAADASKFILDRADKAIETKQSAIEKSTTPFGVSPGETQVRYDPTTGKMTPIYTAPEKESTSSDGGFTIGSTRYDSQGNVVVSQPEGKPEADKKAADYAMTIADRTNAQIDAAINMVGPLTAGWGSLLSALPESQARTFKGMIDTIRGNIGFNELTAMRQASPTGGALGAVSERELSLLTSVLGSLDAGQDPEVLKANLTAIKTHFENWKAAVQQSQAESAGGTTGGDLTFNW